MTESVDEILTAGEVGKILKISRATVYRLNAEGSLRASHKLFQGEKGWRWSRAEVNAYLSRCSISRAPDELPRRFVPLKLAASADIVSGG